MLSIPSNQFTSKPLEEKNAEKENLYPTQTQKLESPFYMYPGY